MHRKSFCGMGFGRAFDQATSWERSNGSKRLFLDSFQVIEKMERETGFEPATSSLGSWHSTTELLPLAWHQLFS